MILFNRICWTRDEQFVDDVKGETTIDIALRIAYITMVVRTRRAQLQWLWLPVVTLLIPAVVLWSSVVVTADSPSCSLTPLKTLTWNCANRCLSADSPCVVYSSADRSPCDESAASKWRNCPVEPATPRKKATNTANCDVQCFELLPDMNIFKFYVTFNPAQVTTAPATPSTNNTTPSISEEAGPELTNVFPNENNAFVRRIGVLQLPTNVEYVTIAGGRSGDVSSRGNLVDLEIDAQIFTKAPQVTEITLLNVDLGLRCPDFPALVPKAIHWLDLRNTNLTTVPDSMHALTKLKLLSLSKNFLTEFPSTLSLQQLTDLRLTENELTAFTTTDLPDLKFLHLSENKLETFPYHTLVKFPKLQTLRVDSNPTLKNVVFTKDQFAKIQKLSDFAIDSSSLDTKSCSRHQLQKLPKPSLHSVCVVSVEEWTKLQVQRENREKEESMLLHSESTPANSTSSDNPDPAHATSPSPLSGSDSARGSHGAAPNASIVGVLIGVFIALVVAVGGGVAFVVVRKRRDAREAKRDDEDDDAATGSVAETRSSHPSEPWDGEGDHVDELEHVGSEVEGVGDDLRDKPSRVGTGLELQSIRLATSDLRDVRVMGAGSSSGAIVWLVEYRKTRLLVSKRLIPTTNETQSQNQNSKAHDARRAAFLSEIQIASTLSYPTIVAFVGVAWTCESDLQALFEYMAGGNLRELLNKTTSESLSWHEDQKRKLRIAVDVVKALVYTHSFNPPLLHRNLKAQSVFLTDACESPLQAKLSDFSSARHESDNETMTNTSTTSSGRWLAPEILSGSCSYDAFSDIYAFGVLLSELDTHALPYTDVRDDDGHPLAEVALLQRVAAVNEKLRPLFSETCPVEIQELATKCLAHDPADRPTAMQVEFAMRPLLRVTKE